MDGQNQRFSKNLGHEHDIGRSVLEMHDVGPLNCPGQIFSGPIDKHHRFVPQHRRQGRIETKIFYLLETNSNGKVRFAPDRLGQGENKRLNAAVGSLAGTN